jgi:uncharacterized membrane protein
MNRLSNWLTMTGVAAAFAYYWDPDLGRRRRSLVRDQLLHAFSKTGRAIDTTFRDVEHRLYGTYAELRGCLKGRDTSDEVVVDRVRSKMGRYVSHPSSLAVVARDGIVTLRGPILTHEVDDFLTAMKSIPGVVDIIDQLDPHETSEDISAFQGGVPRTGEPAEWRQEIWSPAARLAAGTIGAALMLNCATRRNALSPILGVAGFGLFLRAATNTELKRLFGLSGGRRGLEFQKTILINRPVDEVFSLLADPTRYPEFSDVICSVRALGDDRYQKTLRLPGGIETSITEQLTAYEPDQLVACRSESGSPLKYAGRVRFVPLSDSQTKVEVHATYNPPGGILSHAAAAIAQLDLKSQLNNTLMRAKSYLETGRAPHDAKACAVHGSQSSGGARREPPNDESASVDEASEESFPASDAPSYTRSSITRSAGPGEGGHERSRAVADPTTRNLMDL